MAAALLALNFAVISAHTSGLKPLWLLFPFKTAPE